jgi:hypothetical protein
MPERRSLVQVDGWADLACEDSAAKLLTNKGVYDVSACDILDHGLDLVYYHPSKVAHRHSETPLWKYWTMVILAIVLVRCLSYNVQGLWEAGHSDAAASEGGGAGTMTRGKEQWPALLASLVLLILVLIDGDAAYVTTADQLFFWSTAAYILAYLAIHGWAQFKKRIQSPESQGIEDMEQMEEQDEGGADDESPERAQERYERPVYNIIVATLQLVVMHFYSSAETPYNIVLLGMLACRGW